MVWNALSESFTPEHKAQLAVPAYQLKRDRSRSASVTSMDTSQEAPTVGKGKSKAKKSSKSASSSSTVSSDSLTLDNRMHLMEKTWATGSPVLRHFWQSR